MRNLIALTKRELGSLFLAPALHMASGFFVLLYSALFVGIVYTEQTATFDSVALFVCFVSMLLAPLITMRSFAEETHAGTIELLLTAPVGAGEVVLSKFLGAFAFYCATLVPLAVHVLLLDYCGKLDWGATAAVFGGLVLTGATFISIGLFASSLTGSQIVAAATAAGINLILLFLSTLAEEASGLFAALGRLSFVSHFKNSFVIGVVDTRALVYFITFPAGMLFLTWLGVRSRGLLARGGGKTDRRWSLIAGGALALALVAALGGASWMHVSGIGTTDLVAAFSEPEAPEAATSVLGAIAAPEPEAERPALWPYMMPFVASGLLLAGAALAFRRARALDGGGLLTALRQAEIVSTCVAALSVIVLLFNINYLASYPLGALRSASAPLSWLAVLEPRTFDLTETGVNTLSVDTRKTLDELADRVDIIVFYSAAIDYEGVPLLADTRRLLERCAAHSSLVRPVFVDAELERGKALRLAQKMGLAPQYLHQAAIVKYQGRQTIVPAGMCLQAPEAAAMLAGNKQFTFNGELAFTLAFKRLMDPRVTRIYFTDGHGEYTLGTTGQQVHSVGRFAEALQRETFEIRRLFLKDEPIPLDCDVLVLPGPIVPLGGDVIGHIRDYVQRGGRVLVLLPSALQPTRSGEAVPDMDPGLRDLLESWGGRPRNDTLFDHVNRFSGQSMNIYALASQEHPITRSGSTVRCVMPGSRSIRENAAVQQEGWKMQRLLVSASTTQSHRKVDNGVKTGRGPFTLAFTSANRFDPQGPETRVAVFGNTEFVSNLWLDQEHNRALGVATVHWLAGRDYGIRVELPEYVDRSLKMTPLQQRLIAWVSLVWLPLAWVLLAFGVWWCRKE